MKKTTAILSTLAATTLVVVSGVTAEAAKVSQPPKNNYTFYVYSASGSTADGTEVVVTPQSPKPGGNTTFLETCTKTADNPDFCDGGARDYYRWVSDLKWHIGSESYCAPASLEVSPDC